MGNKRCVARLRPKWSPGAWNFGELSQIPMCDAASDAIIRRQPPDLLHCIPPTITTSATAAAVAAMNRTLPLRARPASLLLRPRPAPALVGPDRSRRLYSSETPTPPSAHAAFYKTFGRPIAKVVLTAIFTYQLVYYAWVRLEHNEVKADLNGG